MSDQPLRPEFDDQFWLGVNQRVERVRDLTREELGRAEEALLAVEAAAEVVPVFPAPFWSRINKRAAKVRRMALDELADAEERLMNQQPEMGRASRSRLAAPAILRRLPQLRPIAMSPRARVNTLGFVTAVLAVLMLLPQVMPISSFAGVKPRGPLAIFFSASEPQQAPARESGNLEAKPGDITSNGDSKASPAAPKASKPAPKGTEKASTTVAADGKTPATAAKATNSAAVGASGESPSGADGSSAPGSTNAGTTPAAPSNLLVTAVDDTSVRLRWKDNSADETGFLIERKGQPVSRESTEADKKTYIWAGLSPSSEACFRVRARNDAGSSDWLPEEYKCVTTHAALTSPGPVSLVPLACSNEGSLSSGVKLQEAQITFRNQTAQPVKIFALGAEGVRELTPTVLAPQASTTVNTFLGHPYVVTGTGEVASCLAIFEATSWNTVATITE